MSVVSRIEWAAEQAGIGKRELRRELAEACGISYQSASQWFTGKTKDISAENLSKVAKRLNVSLEWLLTGKGSSSRTDTIVHQGRRTGIVALLNKSDVNDWLNYHKGHIIEKPPVIEELLTNMQLPENAFSLTVDSDMQPSEYRKGDDVFFDPSLTPVPLDVVAASVNGGDSLIMEYREIGLGENGQMIFEIAPLNPAYPSFRSDKADIAIQGVQCEHRIYKRRAR